MIKRFSYICLAALALLAVLQYLLLPIFLRHEKVRERLLESISQDTNGTVQFSDLKLRVFPRLSFEIRNLDYQSKDQEEPLNIKAEKLRAGLSLPGVLRKKIQLRDLTLKGAMINGKTRVFSNELFPFELKDLTINARGIRNKDLGSVRARGRLSSEKNNFEINGSLHLGDLANFKLEEMLCDLTLKLSQVPLEPILKDRLKFLPLRIINGRVSGTVGIVKKTRERKGSWSSKLDLENVLYADPQDPEKSFAKSSQTFESAGSWDVATGNITVHSNRLSADGIGGEFIGSFKIANKGLAEFDSHISFKEFDFEKAVLHYPFLTYWFQNGADLKGKGEIRFQAKGTFSHLTLHGEVVLDDVSVEYSYFHKERGVPLSLIADLELKDRSVWSGTFDFRYQELKTKGTLLKWVPAEQLLNFTLLTNKFRLDTFLKATASAKESALWEGETKVLLNYQGLANDPEAAKIYGVINLDSISYQIKGLPVRTPPLTATLKIENSDITSENSYLEFGDQKADLTFSWKGWESPRVEWSVAGESVDLGTLWMKEDVGALKLVTQFKKELQAKMEGTVGLGEPTQLPETSRLPEESLLPPWIKRTRAIGEIMIKKAGLGGADFTDLEGTFVMENGSWRLVPLRVRTSSGSLWLETEQDLETGTLPEVRIYGKNIPLGQFSSLRPAGNASLVGDISFKLYTVRNPSVEDVVQASFLISRGSLKRVSLLGAVSSLFKEASPSEETTFDNFGSRFRIGEAGAVFNNLVLDSRELSLKGRGTWLRTGEVQFLTETLLSKDWSRKWQKDIEDDERLSLALIVEGKAGDLHATPDPESLKSSADRDFMTSLSREFDALRSLEQQDPSRVSTPSKTQFLGGVSQSSTVPKKAGFFESLFGSRN